MTDKISHTLQAFNPELIDEINASSQIKSIPENTEILREGQYVKVIPLVVDGLIKVYTRHDGKELLLYYIQPNQSCIMSFGASLKNEPSKIYAVTEEETTAILLPVDKVSRWTAQFPDINHLFFHQFNLRYSDLLDTIHHLLFNKLDQRLFTYLKEKTLITGNNPIKLSHRQIANELGTAREVITRTLKKLESEGKVKQHSSSIEVISL